MKTLKQDISPEHLKGYMTALWFQTTDKHRYALLNDANLFGYVKRASYPELCEE